ncbi:MAG: O-antigen ligase family protein [bacterium]
MLQRDINYIFLQISKGLIFVALFTPLIIAEVLFPPYVFPKTIFLRIIIELILIFYLFLSLSDKNYRPKLTALSKMLIVFFLVIFIASILGQDIWRSFFSTLERSEGLVTLFHLGILVFIIPSIFRTKDEFVSLFDMVVLVNLIVSLYALGQKFHLFLFLPGAGTRLFSTIGNAGALASFLLLGTFIALALFLSKKSRRSPRVEAGWRIFYATAILLNTFIIFNSQTRSTILALFVAFFVLIIGLIFFSPKKEIKLTLIILILLMIGVSFLIYLNRETPLVKNNQVLQRLVTTKLTEPAIEDRVFAWAAGLRGFADRPILGWGWENFNYAFNQYFPPQIYRDSGSTLYFDRAHNILIELLVTTGPLGLLSYLAIIIFAFYALLKEKKIFSQIMALGLLAYFLNNLFSFDWLISWLLFFLLLAYANFLLLKPTLVNEKEKELSPFIYSTIPILILIIGFFLNVKPLEASYQLNKIIYQPPEPKTTLAQFDQILSCRSCDQEAYFWLTVYAKQLALLKNFPREEKLVIYKKIDERLIKIIARHPQNVAYLLNLLSFYNDVALLDPNYHQKIEEWGKTALKFSPSRPQIYYELAKAEISLKNYDQAIDYLKKAVFIAPKNYEPHQKLAEGYFLAGQTAEAEEEVEIIKKLGGQVKQQN